MAESPHRAASSLSLGFTGPSGWLRRGPGWVCGSLADPFLDMGYALALAACPKVGTGMVVLPGRQRALVARQPRPWPGLAPRRVLPVSV